MPNEPTSLQARRAALLHELALIEVPRIEHEIERAIAQHKGPRIDQGARRRMTVALRDEVEKRSRELLRTKYAAEVEVIADALAQRAIAKRRKRAERGSETA